MENDERRSIWSGAQAALAVLKMLGVTCKVDTLGTVAGPTPFPIRLKVLKSIGAAATQRKIGASRRVRVRFGIQGMPLCA